MRWFGLSTVLIAHDRELMELMARSGCRGLLLGLETITPASLGDANKRFNGSVDYRTLIADLGMDPTSFAKAYSVPIRIRPTRTRIS